MGAETAATPVSVKIETGISLRQIPFHGDARMPLSLAPEAMEVLRALSEPIDQRRRSDFLQEATRRLEAAPVVGPGTAHQVGRLVQRDFFDPPQDLRQNRVGPRGPRG
jgi:hypothetical protein